MNKLLILLLAVLITGCSLAKDLLQEEELLDEKKLVQTLAQELDAKKDAAIEKLGQEAERVAKEVSKEVREELLPELMEKQQEILTELMVQQQNVLDHTVKNITDELNRKHAELLGRMPLYGLFLVLLLWGASVIDDVFRWLVGKKKKWGKNGDRVQ